MKNKFTIEIPSIHNLFFSLNNYNELTDKNEEIVVPAESEIIKESVIINHIKEYHPKYYKRIYNQCSNQLKALLFKNFILFKRNKLLIIFQMIIPSFIFILGYLTVQAAFPTPQKR